MKNIFLVALCLIKISFLIAQNSSDEDYKVFQSAGKIPSDFTNLSSQKYLLDREQISEDSTRHIQRSQDQFFLESNFLMDQVLHSGRVTFGDPVTKYLNTIKDNLLKDEPALREKIRIYTFRSSEVNAYTTNNGIVMVTTGLVAQVENEAQIAFILSHEFNHYIRHHALSEYVINREIEKGRGIYRNLRLREIQSRQFQYSKDLESEADSLGVLLFANSEYSPEAVKGVFDVLLYSYLPFDEEPFDRNFFNDSTYNIPQDYFLESTASVTAIEDYDDSQSSHPNIKTRRLRIIEEVKKINSAGKKLFVQPESDFVQVQKLCRYEDCRLYLNDDYYEDAFYNIYLLMGKEGQSKYLQNLMARSLYALSVYKNEGALPENHRYYKDIEGESQQVFYLFYKMPKKEMNILALKYAYAAYRNDSSNSTLEAICEQLASSLKNNYNLVPDDFKSEYASAADSVKKEEKKSGSKYEKIKSSESVKVSDAAYWRFAFVHYMNDPSFQKLFNVKSKSESHSQGFYSSRQRHKEDFALSIDKTVIVNPLYLQVDETARNPVRYMSSEAMKIDLKNKINECAQLLDLNVDFLEAISLKDADTEKFNDIAMLNDWISEQIDHEDVPVINSNNERMQELSEKYHTSHISWLGVISYKEKKENLGLEFTVGLIVWPILPFTIVRMIRPNYSTAAFSLVADAKTGVFEMKYFNTMKAKDLTSIQKSNLYYILQQMKSKPK